VCVYVKTAGRLLNFRGRARWPGRPIEMLSPPRRRWWPCVSVAVAFSGALLLCICASVTPARLRETFLSHQSWEAALWDVAGSGAVVRSRLSRHTILPSVGDLLEDATYNAKLAAEEANVQMLLDADSVEQTLDDSLHWLGQLLPTPPTINFPWLDELTATAKAKKDGVTQFYESRIAQGFYSAAQAAGVGDLTPGGFAVKWEELAIIGDGGVRLKAVVAYPKAGAAEAARFPVVVLCNSWVMNWWEYAMKQQEWVHGAPRGLRL